MSVQTAKFSNGWTQIRQMWVRGSETQLQLGGNFNYLI